MINTHHITTLDLPDLLPYRTLRRPMDHWKRGIFVAEGGKVVFRLLDSSLSICSVLITPEWFNRICKTHQSALEKVPNIYIADKGLMETIVGYNLHQGILVVAYTPKERPLHELIDHIAKPHFLVALDGLVNAENVGTIVRNCVAFGVDALIVGETSCSPYMRRAVRNSMGTIFQLPVYHATKLVETLQLIRQQYQTDVLAAHPHQEALIYEHTFLGNMCIVFGNEGDGISHEVLSACTAKIAIPMKNRIDSLNVASACAVFLYEVRKLRG